MRKMDARALPLVIVLALLLFLVLWCHPAAATTAEPSTFARYPPRALLDITSRAAPAALTSTCTVTSTADSGDGTFRQCLLQAATSDTIQFDPATFPPGSPVTISISSALPQITQGHLTIDGRGAGVILDGASLVIRSNNNQVQGLQMVHGGTGIDIGSGASSNVISGNVLSGFSYAAVYIHGAGTVSNTVAGNLLGTDASGTAAIGNGTGVKIHDGAQYNVIGGATAADRNIISGSDGVNIGDGIDINNSHYNTIIGNHIGTDLLGTTALPNGAAGIGICCGASYNVVGGTPDSARNLISGNTTAGVTIFGAGSDDNQVQGNYIGTSANGTAKIPNGHSGVRIWNGARYNIIGGASAGQGNLVSGNNQHGIAIDGAETMSNTVSGNYVGTDASGLTALGNQNTGIHIEEASYQVIGGDTPGEGNLSSGNGGPGVQMLFGAHHNTILGNYVGTNATGTAAVSNQGIGVQIGEGAHHNTIGNPNGTEGGTCAGPCNLIAGNKSPGVVIGDTGSDSNQVTGNYIGTKISATAAITNEIGVQITHGARYNVVGGGNTIASNQFQGVHVDKSATLSNTITQNSIYDNGGRGIELTGGGNTGLAAPIIQTYDRAAGTSSGTACANCTIEVFSDDGDEGQRYEGSTTADSSGAWSLTVGHAFAGPYLTATATDTAGNTSEFSLPAQDRTCIVISAADSGSGTLRRCLLQATTGYTITFDTNLFAPSSPQTITLTSGPLPALSQGSITLDGSQAGVILDGSQLASGYGLHITSDHNIVKGLQILHFPERGIQLDGASYNTIGGNNTALGSGCSGACNLVSGNATHGIYISTGHDNTVSGNYIGTDVTGASRLGNGDYGIVLEQATQNYIGGINATPGASCSGECNLISANGNAGILLSSTTMSNTVSGNYVGTDVTGTTDRGNSNNGIIIDAGAAYNTIGGGSPALRNLISGNTNSGVWLVGGAHHNTVQGNYIGTDITGLAALGNDWAGIDFKGDAERNRIQGNLISGNGGNGVYIGTGHYNTLVENLIGTDTDGAHPLSNGASGVYIAAGSTWNTIGGSNATPASGCSGECNLISGNGTAGVYLLGNDSGSNTISGNYIGTNRQGTSAMSNGQWGMILDNGAAYNIIGGSTPGERNLISGNTADGVYLGGAHHNAIRGNDIGTDATGTADLGNGENGVQVTLGSTHNTIGGSNTTPGSNCSGECNLVSGNGKAGILISGGTTVSNTVSGNYVGTTASGLVALGNGNNGAILEAGTAYNLVGGDTPGERNLISGNANSGVWLVGGAHHNTVQHNFLGSDTTGMAPLGNDWAGVDLKGDAEWNLISGNLISANGQDGVYVGSGQSNTLTGNHIGTDSPGTGFLGNLGNGIHLLLGSADNTIGPWNTIAYNAGDGIHVHGATSVHNHITRNSIWNHLDGQGIDLVDGGNSELPAPVITSIDLLVGAASGAACATCTVEVFSDDRDEGRVYEGSAVADATGAWSLALGEPFTGPRLTATATNAEGNSSEFSTPVWATPPRIDSILPSKGSNDVPTTINLYGYNFQTGLTVTLHTTPTTALPTTRLSSIHLRTRVPAGLDPGLYDVSVTNLDQGADTLPKAFAVLDAAQPIDDLYANRHDLWHDPVTLRQGQSANLGLVVRRQGGISTLTDLLVRFYMDDPRAGGTAIGDGNVFLMSPDSSASTTQVPWNPAADGEYTIYAVIDPLQAISETIEANNTVSKTITVLPPAADTLPPQVTNLIINSGIEVTGAPTVTLTVSATDNAGGSGLGSVYFVEFEFVQAVLEWVPVQASGWQPYASTHPWTLVPVAGTRYIQAWAADRASNVSLAPYKDSVNYVPPSDTLAAGEIRVYRQHMAAGQQMVITVTPLSGDPDLYVWRPTAGEPAWVSDNSTGIDQVSVTAPETGVYQIEIVGYTAAEYSLSMTVTTTAIVQGAAEPLTKGHQAKTVRTAPVIAVSEEPAGQMSLPAAPYGFDIRLPLTLRAAITR